MPREPTRRHKNIEDYEPIETVQGERVGDQRIEEDETLFVATGEIASYSNLVCLGYLRVEGVATVKDDVVVRGTLDNKGEVNIDWDEEVFY